MLHPLENVFGFATNCFVCEPANAVGLRMRFFLDDERGVVTATHTFGSAYSGAPALVHGGVVAAACDEAMAWAAIALGRHFALTAETRLSYLTPVPIDVPLTVTGRLIGRVGRQMWLMADVRTGGSVHVRAESRATVMGEELSAAAGVPTTVEGSAPADPQPG